MQVEDGKLTEWVGRPWAMSPCSEQLKVPCPSPASSLLSLGLVGDTSHSLGHSQHFGDST